MADKIVDLSYLNDLARGNQEFMIEMINIFLEHAYSNVESLKKFINESDWKEAENLSHKMKSSYAYFGVKELQESMQIIESDCHNNIIDIQKISSIINRAEEITPIIVNELKNEIKNLS